jgi:hypothetical protein
MWAGSNERHRTTEHIEELRPFINTQSAKNRSHSGQMFITGISLSANLFARDLHRAKLEREIHNSETLSTIPPLICPYTLQDSRDRLQQDFHV